MTGAASRRLFPHRGEEGSSLVELLVAMAVLTIVSGIFTVAFISVQQSVRKQNGETDAQTYARTAFTLLDRQVRYANALNDPAVANGSQYVEWQSGDNGATQTCTQYRAVTATGLLQYRQWQLTAAAPTTPSPASPVWTTVLGGLNLSSGSVFATPTADTGGVFSGIGEPTAAAVPIQRELSVNLNLTFGSKSGNGNASISSVFSAQNTTNGFSPTTPVCQQLGRP